MTFNLDFCDKFSYHSQIKKDLEVILGCFPLHQLRSIVLFGSTSRGELSYTYKEDCQLELFSDYEFLLLHKNFKSISRNFIHERLREVQSKLAYKNPFFHIDFSARPLFLLRYLPKTIRTFETKKQGKVVYGEDVIDRIPRITIHNLDFGDLNSLIIIRLTDLLFALPDTICTNDEREETVLKYSLSRNGLEISTILLPHEGYLIPGFQKRVEFIEHNFHNLSSAKYFSKEFPNLLKICLDGKMNISFSTSLHYLYEMVLQNYISLVNFIENLDRQYNKLTSLVNYLNSSEIDFKPHSLFTRRKIKEVLYSIDYIISRKDISTRRKFYGLVLSFLLYMNKAAIYYLSGEDSTKYLLKASQILNRLTIKQFNFKKDETPVILWAQLRRAYLELAVANSWTWRRS